MIRATSVIKSAQGFGEAADTIELDFDQRHRRRVAMRSSGGLEFLLDLPQATALAGGDGLVLEDGRIVQVKARPERVADITAADPRLLLRVGWHLGNRHLPTEILENRLRIRQDHVIVELVRSLGAEVELTEAPFQPEGGAYGGAHGAAHDH